MSLWDRVKGLFGRESKIRLVDVPPPPGSKTCRKCKKAVTVWRTYSDGQVYCVRCDTVKHRRVRA